MSNLIQKETFLKMNNLEKLEYMINESIKTHAGKTSQYWKGSQYMAECTLDAIRQIREVNAGGNQEDGMIDGIMSAKRTYSDKDLEEAFQGGVDHCTNTDFYPNFKKWLSEYAT